MQFARWMVPGFARSNPWFNAADLAWEAYNFGVDGGFIEPVLSAPGKTKPGQYAIPAGYTLCGTTGPVSWRWTEVRPGDASCAGLPTANQGPGFDAGSDLFGNYPKGIRFETEIYSPGRVTVLGYAAPIASDTRPLPNLVRQPGVKTPGVSMQDYQQPWRNQNQWRGLPHGLVPYAPQAPDRQMGPTRSYGSGFRIGDAQLEPVSQPAPGAPSPNPHKPPPPRTKEKKARAPGAVAKLVTAAWDVTEAVDLVENLFECLPKAVQKTVPKTGRTSRTAFVGEGKKYANPLDKARHVYRHTDKLDTECAMTKLACNQIMDNLWGRFFAGADSVLYGGGVIGGTTAMRSDLMVDPAERDKFKKWIEAQPGLDDFLKSLQCENWGVWKSLLQDP